MTRLGDALAAMPAGQCCPDYSRQERYYTPGAYAETHSYGCPATAGARKTFDDPGSARDRWFGCSDADREAWEENDAYCRRHDLFDCPYAH